MKKLWIFSLVLLVVVLTNLNLSGSALDLKTRWSEFLSEEGNSWRAHFDDTKVRSAYGISTAKSGDADQAAASFLERHHSLFGVESLADLRLERTEQSELGTHYYYRQYYGGFKVVGGEVGVHVNKDQKVIAVTSDYRPGLKGTLAHQPGAAAAVHATAKKYVGGSGYVQIGELMVYPMGDRSRLVWEVQAASTRLSKGSWLLYIDAANPNMALMVRKTHATFTGKGTVFAENAVVTPTRVVRDFTNMDGSKKLAGKFAQAYNANFENDIDDPVVLSDYSTSSEASRKYDYAVNDGRFTEAMAFFHINVVHDRFKALGFNKMNAKAPVFVNVAESDGGPGYDNAFYTRDPRFRTGMFVFGAGSVFENLGQDADVYYHEYGHGILDHAKPGFFSALESNYPGAFHEGFGDMVAAAISGNPKIAEFGLRLKASKRFVGRNIDNNNSFPASVVFPPLRTSEVHHTGLIAGGAWWDLQQMVGADTSLRLLYRSLSLLPNEMNFFDFRDAMLTADRNTTGGANAGAIQQAFSAHGLGGQDPGQPGSVVLNGLKPAAYNFNTGNVTLKNTFKRGDTIVIIANYKGTALVPGYNLIPVDADLKTPPNAADVTAFLLVGEVGNGARSGKNGAFQAVLFTDDTTTKGQYSVSIRSRLGGTNQTTTMKTVKFKVN